MVIHELLLKVVVLGTIILGPSHNHVAGAADLMAKLCRSTCGSLSIPYPFGLSDSDPHCRINRPSFTVYCDYSTNPPTPYMNEKGSNIKILDISIKDQELRVNVPVGQDCYSSSGYDNSSRPWFAQPEFPISSTKNKFTAVGCDTSAKFNGSNGKFSFGCMSSCSDISDVSGGPCSGIGCCQTSIPKNTLGYEISIWSDFNHAFVLKFNPCSYAFVAENDFYNFSVDDLSRLKFNESALVLDWAIGDQTCEEAKKTTSYMCTKNANCTNAENGSGYKCNCLEGYQGNPYLENGCRDIDECAYPEKYPCEGKCNNIEGNYTCSCPKGYHSNSRMGGGDGQGCTANPSHLMKILVGVAMGIIGLLFSIGFLYFGYKQRKLIRLKEQYFKKNGGLLLQQQLHERDRTTKTAKIFSVEELEKATDNYDETRIVGQGGYGTVYKGLLPDNMVVAIKKSKLMDPSQIEQFINEVIVLSQINNRNVVKLLGCCLETEVPLLVYEYVNNGTLFDHVHNTNKSSKLSWETRLRIALETAGVLSYLHSTASTPIIHRDVKSANILLDDNYIAKVSDFGASRLVPLDQKQLSTMVQGTLGYLDPEYFHTSQLTEKSDVYSFGVVLAELLTGRKALSFDRPEEERSLATYFLSSLKNDKLFQIIEEDIANEGNNEQVREVANLAERCLKLKGEERPTMKEVAIELEGLRAMAKHPWATSIDVNLEETVHLLGEKPNVYMDSIAITNTAYTDSMKNHVSIDYTGSSGSFTFKLHRKERLGCFLFVNKRSLSGSYIVFECTEVKMIWKCRFLLAQGCNESHGPIRSFDGVSGVGGSRGGISLDAKDRDVFDREVFDLGFDPELITKLEPWILKPIKG
ncbi:wall-associated receptor kinase 5-like [Eucalyptus grandis]|uniref:wall-associated receptor kinase 5-like n=1 Tax=Eucalyptus grandis TaxID=71139 RepID=UPI00192EF4F1|nr:wall-associated receptor kinase 5-like [Eucalyptus grandis]